MPAFSLNGSSPNRRQGAMMQMGSRLALVQSRVAAEWVDYNGHMNDACYCILFSRAVDEFMVRIGVDPAYRQATHHSMYTLEMHVRYLQEVREGAPVALDAQLLGSEAKKVRVFLRMMHGDTGALLATSEQLLLHVDQQAARAAPFPADVTSNLAKLVAGHETLPRPEGAGRGIALQRSKGA
ncbi:MAG TPA: thioesterase family protein [Gammaproteobacteria bacterium]|nr:thioesterase family protein [Gammaproteobacteria bacterium]